MIVLGDKKTFLLSLVTLLFASLPFSHLPLAAPGAPGGDEFKTAKLKDARDPFEDKYNPSAADGNLRDCFHSTSKRNITCTASAALKTYPQMQDKCGKSGGAFGCSMKVPVEGCYDLRFKRMDGPIPGGGKCMDPSFPFRVQVQYQTDCPAGGTCHRGSEIKVSTKIFNDGLPNEAYSFDNLNKVRDGIGATISGDPVRVACASLVDDGFRWNIKKNICDRSLQAVCEDILGLQWVDDPSMPQLGRCVSQNVDCMMAFGKKQPAICSPGTTTPADYCTGYRYPAKSTGGIDCFCEGTATDVDKNNRTCGTDRSYTIYEDTSKPQGTSGRRRFNGGAPAP
ncbi:MAG: hypothetical protein EOP04_22010 [Proteobacteria bacterium]|nr:MAG: hypothetical protein EOP04_22010 [Pseudomonadota bacterium]